MVHRIENIEFVRILLEEYAITKKTCGSTLEAKVSFLTKFVSFYGTSISNTYWAGYKQIFIKN